MFRARKFVEVPSKRSGGLLSPPHADLLAATGGTATATTYSKRQRLQLEAAEAYYHNGDSYYQQQQQQQHVSVDMEHATTSQDAAVVDNVLVETPECTITMVDTFPSALSDEIRKEKAAHSRGATPFPQILSCRASIPSARHRSGRQWLVYFVVVLRAKVLLWHEGEASKVLSLPLPDELDDRDVLQPFLFALYGQSLSLMVISRSGVVLFWEDIDLPYESVPLSVQIPLQDNESVFTHADALLSPLDAHARELEALESDDSLKSIVCWSNQGNVWEVAMEDRRIRVRAFEKRAGGFLAGLTKSVSQFFFASSAAHTSGSSSSNSLGISSGSDLDVNLPIKFVKVVPTIADDDDARSTTSLVDDTADMLVLFSNGVVDRRTFSTSDVMDCACVSVRHFDATRVAISYFSDTFPDQHLAKVEVVSLPYVLDDCFALLVAFVCASREDARATVKYAIFQFSLGSTSESPEPEWACVLDYEPPFVDASDMRPYFDVECVGIARGAFYLVWPHAAPIQFASILLPRPGQTSVRYSAFSLQGMHDRTARGFSARVEPNAFGGDASKGSVSFVLLEDAVDSKLPSGTVCVATASNMQNVDALPLAHASLTTASIEKSRKRLDEASRLTGESPHFLAHNLDVQEYVRLLTTHFRDDPHSASPLRIASADALAVAQAAVAIDFEILDAKPSSGLRWSKADTDDATRANKTTTNTLVTPKLVRFQLEEKRARRAEFLAFLERRCANVWQTLVASPDLRRYVTEDDEKLHAAISLSKFQGSLHAATDAARESSGASHVGAIERRLTGQFLLHAIEKTVEQRGYQREQLRLAGYNAFDIFYCEVSKIPELFASLSVEVQKLGASIGESDPAYLCALLEAGYSMLSMLKPSASATESHKAFAPTGSWAFTRPVRDVIVEHIARLTALVGYTSAARDDTEQQPMRWTSDEVFEVTDQIKRLGSLLLDAYARFLPSLRGEDAEDVRKEAELSKRCVLNPLVFVATNTALSGATDHALGSLDLEHRASVERQRMELFSQCVTLCETYAYYEGMVFLAYTEDAAHVAQLDYALGAATATQAAKTGATKRLEAYCKAFEAFPAFLFRWYSGDVRNPWPVSPSYEARAQSTMRAFLLAHSKLFGASLHAFVQSHAALSKLAWVTALAIERYDDAATYALHDATREQTSLAKRKTMASLAKIAALAAPDTSRNEENAQLIQREVRLPVCRWQMALARSVSLLCPNTVLCLSIDFSWSARRSKRCSSKCRSIARSTCDRSHATSSSTRVSRRRRPSQRTTHSGTYALSLSLSCCHQSLTQEMRALSRERSTNLFVLALEAIETIESEASAFDAALTKTWRHCLCDDAALWTQLIDEHASSGNDHALEQRMRQTLLFSAMQQYLSHRTHATAALTLDVLDDVLTHGDDNDDDGDEQSHAVLNVQSRHVMAKTLAFALAH